LFVDENVESVGSARIRRESCEECAKTSYSDDSDVSTCQRTVYGKEPNTTKHPPQPPIPPILLTQRVEWNGKILFSELNYLNAASSRIRSNPLELYGARFDICEVTIEPQGARSEQTLETSFLLLKANPHSSLFHCLRESTSNSPPS
jgi:hypothetical protein